MRIISIFLLLILQMPQIQIDGKASTEFTLGYQQKIYDDSNDINGLFFGSLGVIRLTDNCSFSYIFSSNQENTIDVNTLAASYDNILKIDDEVISYRISIGDILIPVGLYELQRLYPNPYTPPSLNDSFIQTKYRDFFDNNQYGIRMDVDWKDFSLQYSIYSPREKVFDNEKGIHFFQRQIESYMELHEKEYSELSNQELLQLEQYVLGLRPDHTTYSGSAQFVQLQYDNRKDILIDLEQHIQRLSLEGHKNISVSNDSYRIGIEKKVFERVFLVSEYMLNTMKQDDYYDQIIGKSQSILYDAGKYTPYIGQTNFRSKHADINEQNIGVTITPKNNVYMRLNYRAVEGTWNPLDRILSDINNDCGPLCSEISSSSPFNKYGWVGSEYINDKGIEFQVAVIF